MTVTVSVSVRVAILANNNIMKARISVRMTTDRPLLSSDFHLKFPRLDVQTVVDKCKAVRGASLRHYFFVF
jgi:hypothetical protein